ncbi:membrane protein [Streptomyces aureoverticillatus]|nr:membrane protein [Streptomyces aureoverticillatus]
MRQPGPLGRLGTTPPVPRRPTTWLLLGSVLLFALCTWQAAVDGPLRRLDERAGRALTDSRLPEAAAELLADLGNMTVAVPVLALVVAYTAWRARRAGAFRWWLPPLTAVLAMVAVPVLVIPLKLAVDRAAPPGMDGSGYYPSGHTATATVAYGAAALLLLPLVTGTYARRELVIGCALLNVGVGFGLVRSGYHWPLDVLGSWCLGAILLQLMVLTITRSSCRSSSRTPSC